jgi:dynein intermediate chain 1, axonemal
MFRYYLFIYLLYFLFRDDPEEVNLSGLAGGCCFSFNKHNEHLFIVGTEEGKIHKCSKVT